MDLIRKILFNMELIHYTKEPFTLAPREYQQRHDDFMKPNGLWFSIENKEEDYYGWKEWCEDSEFRLEALEYKYLIQLADNAHILELTNLVDMFRFNKEYSIPENITWDRSNKLLYEPTAYKIKWNEIRAKYQGIFIYPYHYELRLRNDFTWYYGWDCSSGCIWDLNAIKEIKKI